MKKVAHVRPVLALFAFLACFCPTPSTAQWETEGTSIYSSNAGNVGVGTSSPVAKLHVNGDGFYSGRFSAQAAMSFGTEGGGAQFVVGLQNELANWEARGGTLAVSTSGGATVSGAHLPIQPQCSGSCSSVTTLSGPGAVVYEFTGLGTFDVMSSRTWGVYLQVRRGLVPASIKVELQDQTGTWQQVWFDSAPEVRLGLWYPPLVFKPFGDNTDPKGVRFTVGFEGTGASYIRALGFYHQNRALGTYTFPFLHSDNVYSGENVFEGNVGIGTTSPSEKLHVEGNVVVTGTLTGGNIQAKYQDIAEWVPSVDALSPGTVVTLDPERSNHVISSRNAYDTTVAGVVSPLPGLILGDAADNKVMVATVGRVRVRVDASLAPIVIGDLLVSSDRPGVAMKSEPLLLGTTPIHRPGTLIGKALEPLNTGTGEILVLLSLQ